MLDADGCILRAVDAPDSRWWRWRRCSDTRRCRRRDGRGVSSQRCSWPRLRRRAPPCHSNRSAGTRLGSHLELNRVGMITVGEPSAKNVSYSSPGAGEGRHTSCHSPSRLSNGHRAGRCGRSNAARTCWRIRPCSTRGKLGPASPREVFNYYLGWIVNPKIKRHFNPVPNRSSGLPVNGA